MSFDYDVVVVGSGFGGSVAALRLTEKGYRVLVVEAGRRFADADFARTSWHLRDFLWAPGLGCFGIQRITRLRNVLVLAGAGVGGGSLVYANTLYRPMDAFYADPSWGHLTDWKAEFAPYYDQASRMLGVTDLPHESPADAVMRRVADQMGVGSSFRKAPVGVFFNPGPDGAPRPGEAAADPFFGGAGPERRGCLECGECMTGCRHGAKNTLVKNYLHLAERAGAEVRALTTVTDLVPLAGGGYEVRMRPTGGVRPPREATTSGGDRTAQGEGRRRARVTAGQVVLAAGALGTQKLLHAQRDRGNLPRLSPRLGALTRTNSEALLGAIADDDAVDYSRGVAITSSFYPDAHTHVEPVRYGRGSNAMGLLQTVLTDGREATGRARWRTWLAELWRQRRELRKLYDLRGWSQRTVIALVMQSDDNSITTFTRRGLLGRRMTSRQGHGAPNPSWIPAANEAVRRMATVMRGTPGGTIGEPFDVPMTAHFMGGCAIGASAEEGVVDPYLRVFGHEGLHVVDGSAISANLGVNPSLTITAQAERAFALWPNRCDDDPRPALGDPYVPLAPVAPRWPVVPESAPGALRLPTLPVVEVRHGPAAHAHPPTPK